MRNIATGFRPLDAPGHNRLKSPLLLGLMVGGFVGLVFDSVALGLLAGSATFFLIKRDQREDEPS